jgi:hypothetical protein
VGAIAAGCTAITPAACDLEVGIQLEASEASLLITAPPVVERGVAIVDQLLRGPWKRHPETDDTNVTARKAILANLAWHQSTIPAGWQDRLDSAAAR